MQNTNVKKEDFIVKTLGPSNHKSPIAKRQCVDDNSIIAYYKHASQIKEDTSKNSETIGFVEAGPREKLFFDPKATICGIVTCGGLCPGINDVIRGLVRTLLMKYSVPKVYGFKYGYEGLCRTYGHEILTLDEEAVDNIQEDGGSMLGSSRGPQNNKEIVDTLERLGVNVLFTIGGDGTLRGAHSIYEEITGRNLPISIIGIPKTIDNDISFMEKTFGLETAVAVANDAIRCAHTEANSAFNGISVIKLMGRESGFIAAYAALGSGNVNYCLIPESPFSFDGENGLLNLLHRRLQRKHHAVIVVAEGAGSDIVPEIGKDASGNIKRADIGEYVVKRVKEFLIERRISGTVKYIDPSYMVRSVPANANDSAFCSMFAQNAVHAAMAGYTDCVIGYWSSEFTIVPITLATTSRKKISLDSDLWNSVLQQTGQPFEIK